MSLVDEEEGLGSEDKRTSKSEEASLAMRVKREEEGEGAVSDPLWF